MTVSPEWIPGPPQPDLAPDVVHVWRIGIASSSRADHLWDVLSADEQHRASRFYLEEHRIAFVLAHGAMRRILAVYQGVDPRVVAFSTQPRGKPMLRGGGVEFNLSHSGDLALLAVARDKPVGVDVEQWNHDMEHTDVAVHCFSQRERDVLGTLVHERGSVVAAFFAAWSRKEAYIKATGDGVSRGLDHFDVTLAPGDPALLLADRSDASAVSRWTMHALPAGEGYSAALVAAAPVSRIELFDADALVAHPRV